MSPVTESSVVLHGHRISYRSAGSGSVLLLLHGITSSATTWDDVLPWLAERHTVVAPDLLGHGQSAKPRTDYSLGAQANGLRDLLAVLGHERATVVGHSLGGGIALQLAYQYPELGERLVLVSSGGLGREVHALLRAAALPGSEWVLPLLCRAGLQDAVAGAARFLARLGMRAGPDVEEVWRGYTSLADPACREAFMHTLRAVVEPGGQRVCAVDRLYLTALMPTLIVWGDRDPMIPVEHGHSAHRAMPGSRLDIFPGAGHLPHRDKPWRFVRLLLDFVSSTEAARVDAAGWRSLIRQ
jgi:pimeloyl-ACP methyl ester carboxylesterase